ncbi:hypothetical protein PPH41_25645, partial [Burkholderia gladioli]|nr:hypothetical protein [Burkholderia gladioli]
AGRPIDTEVLGPLVSRKIHYRLATAPFGAMLRDLTRRERKNSPSSTLRFISSYPSLQQD